MNKGQIELSLYQSRDPEKRPTCDYLGIQPEELKSGVLRLHILFMSSRWVFPSIASKRGDYVVSYSPSKISQYLLSL